MAKPKLKLKFFSSWDDGGKFDGKLADLLLYYGLPGTFFIPSQCNLELEQILEIAKNFEIGGHTVSHFQNLKLLDDDFLKAEILDNKIWLEEILGKKVTQFCYPRGRFDDRIIQAVKDSGFVGARTTLVGRFKFDDPFKIGTSVHVFQRQEYGEKSWVEFAKEMAAKAAGSDYNYFHLWGHSAEIDKFKQWTNLENFFVWLKRNYDLQFETLDELCLSRTSKTPSTK